jgi:beta-lactamase class A
MNTHIPKRLFALLLCLILLCPAAAFAEGESAPAAEEEDYGILDPAALQQLVDDYCARKGLSKENLSVGFCYTATGDTWYHNPDAWYYSASMYKVPVMMILAERYKAGEITDETRISGLTLAEANELILVYSHNDYAHAMMHYIGTDAECRTLYQNYAQLPKEYYVQDFYDYSYFTARFMTQVMQTLYYEQDRFPNVIEHLLLAQPGQYFKASITDVPVAQKYGNYCDSMGRQWTHNTGIIYTDNPFILTIMSKNMGQSDAVVADFCRDFEDYARTLDTALPAYLQAQQQAAEEEARSLAGEEEARSLAGEEEARSLAGEEEQIRLEEESPAEDELSFTGESVPAQKEPAAEPDIRPESPAPSGPVYPHGAKRSVMIGFAVVFLLLLAAFLVEYTAYLRERRYARSARSGRGR